MTLIKLQCVEARKPLRRTLRSAPMDGQNEATVRGLMARRHRRGRQTSVRDAELMQVLLASAPDH